MNYDDMFDESGPEGLYGVYVGIVTDIKDPEDMARVKLSFPWRDKDDESRWARIATPMAGAGIGTYFLPEPGDEVLVAFADGDIHEPYVIGELWNGKDKPPHPNKKENPKREIRSRAEHTITFDDDKRGKKPAGKVEIKSSKRNLKGKPKGHEIRIDDNNDKIVIEDHNKNKITLDDSGITIESPKTIKLKGKNVEIKADKNVDVSGQKIKESAKTSAKMKSSGSMTLKAGTQLKINATAGLTAKTSGMMKLNGSMIMLN